MAGAVTGSGEGEVAVSMWGGREGGTVVWVMVVLVGDGGGG